MNKIFLDPQIYYIENVLSDEDLAIVQNFAKDESGWRINKDSYGDEKQIDKSDVKALTLGSSSSRLKSMNDEVYDIFLKMFDNIIVPAEPDLNIFPVSELQSFTEGYRDQDSNEWAMHPHQDNHKDFAITANIEKGLVYYLNDDFEGGEIVYVNKNITHKPVANSIIVHSSYKDYTHGVKIVNSGTRYVMTNFYRS